MGLKPNTKRVKNSFSGVCLDRGRSWTPLPQSSRVWSAVGCDQNKFVMRLHAKFWFLTDTMWEKNRGKNGSKNELFPLRMCFVDKTKPSLKSFHDLTHTKTSTWSLFDSIAIKQDALMFFTIWISLSANSAYAINDKSRYYFASVPASSKLYIISPRLSANGRFCPLLNKGLMLDSRK